MCSSNFHYVLNRDELQVTDTGDMAVTTKAIDITVDTAIPTTTADTIKDMADIADSVEAHTKDFS